MYCTCPVVMGMELVPVDVISTWFPLLTVVITVTNSWSEVETSGVVLTMAVVRGADEAAGALDTGAFALLRPGAGAGDVGVLPRLEPGAGVEAGGALEEGAATGVDGSSSGEGEGEGEGAGVADCRCDEGCGAGVEAGGAGVLLLPPPPVPEACLFSPWWMYSATPSMRKPSGRLKADESAKSAYMATSHELRIILVVCLYICRKVLYV